MAAANDVYNVKYILVGDQASGKSSLLLRYSEGTFNASHNVTIGVEFGTKVVTRGNKTIKIQAWDTAGQETFVSITRNFFRGAACAMVVYDVTRRETFDHAERWLRECNASCGNDDIVVMLVANKVDSNRRKVTRKEGEAFAESHGLLYEEVSARTNQNIDKMFNATLDKICDLVDSGKIDPKSKKSGVTLEKKPGAKEKKRCC